MGESMHNKLTQISYMQTTMLLLDYIESHLGTKVMRTFYDKVIKSSSDYMDQNALWSSRLT